MLTKSVKFINFLKSFFQRRPLQSSIKYYSKNLYESQLRCSYQLFQIFLFQKSQGAIAIVRRSYAFSNLNDFKGAYRLSQHRPQHSFLIFRPSSTVQYGFSRFYTSPNISSCLPFVIPPIILILPFCFCQCTTDIQSKST